MPIKKTKSVRKAKIVEEVTLNFRLCYQKPSDELNQSSDENQPFYPSPHESENEEIKNDDDQEEKPKDDNQNQPAEEKDEEQPQDDHDKSKEKEEKVFDRSVKVPPKTRLKNIRRAILENLGVQDICTARIYSCTRPAKIEEEPKKDDEDNEDKEKEDEKPEDAPDADA